MKKLFFLLIPLIVLFGCKPTEKMSDPENDKDVLRPPEGYGNPKYARPAHYLDSLKLKLLNVIRG